MGVGAPVLLSTFLRMSPHEKFLSRAVLHVEL